MDKTVDLHTKTALSKLVSEVEQGGEVIIARGGKPVAKLVAVKDQPKTQKKLKKIDRTPGFMKGQIKILKGFYDPLPDDLLAAMMGEDD
ncbi:MAG TPA: type II toxin-antitoxin system prevent-host-death family antitoxin [Rhizomicrobium sp.]|jgi:prevent-host-death family protein|nr:type II toxin-antitoxin system prevent-host-death family antitoxin [Rhizomicrobium sp.]